ncbi:hypothetical protein [Nocardia niwae]|uniref:Uncharacterized protein n=1 Tax=Nocardia niwae TaxID=626084 RepID=A0ABV2XDE4_9NOCA|nr:hypothetical protein [Nocardia niwae]
MAGHVLATPEHLAGELTEVSAVFATPHHESTVRGTATAIAEGRTAHPDFTVGLRRRRLLDAVAVARLRPRLLAAWHVHLELFFAATQGDIRCPWPADRVDALAGRYTGTSANEFGDPSCPVTGGRAAVGGLFGLRRQGNGLPPQCPLGGLRRDRTTDRPIRVNHSAPLGLKRPHRRVRTVYDPVAHRETCT